MVPSRAPSPGAGSATCSKATGSTKALTTPVRSSVAGAGSSSGAGPNWPQSFTASQSPGYEIVKPSGDSQVCSSETVPSASEVVVDDTDVEVVVDVTSSRVVVVPVAVSSSSPHAPASRASAAKQSIRCRMSGP